MPKLVITEEMLDAIEVVKDTWRIKKKLKKM